MTPVEAPPLLRGMVEIDGTRHDIAIGPALLAQLAAHLNVTPSSHANPPTEPAPTRPQRGHPRPDLWHHARLERQ